MPKRAYPLALVSLTLLSLVQFTHAAPTAHAQSKLVDPYIAAKLTLGLGGSAKASLEQGGTTLSQEQNLEVSIGVAGQYLYPLHDYFSVGGMLDIQTWRSTGNGNAGRNIVFDLAVLPQGKYVVLPKQLELNFSIPLGLALDVLNEVDANNTLFRFASGAAAGGSVKGNTALGFVVGALLGARYQAFDGVGLLLELGYLYRTIGHTITTSVTGPLVGVSNSTDVTVSFGQFALNLGAYF